MLARSLLKHRVTLQRMERDTYGNLSVGATLGDLEALVVTRRAEAVEGGRQAFAVQSTVYIEPDALIDEEHADWKLIYDGHEMDVLSIEKLTNAITGQVDHWRLTTE